MLASHCLFSLLPSCGELAGALFLQRVENPLPLLKSLEFEVTEVVTYTSARRGASKTGEQLRAASATSHLLCQRESVWFILSMTPVVKVWEKFPIQHGLNVPRIYARNGMFS